MSTPEVAIYSKPPEPAVLQAIGIVTIRHSEHEDVLRMLLRTFLHQDAQEARKNFAYMGPRVLRDKAAEISRAIFGPGEVLDQLWLCLLGANSSASGAMNGYMRYTVWIGWTVRYVVKSRAIGLSSLRKSN
jgi:hypothetical protein